MSRGFVTIATGDDGADDGSARYYRIVLVGHASLCADNDLARTYRDLTALGHGVELIDPQLIPGALKEDSSANSDVLGPFLTTFDPDYVAVHGESAAEILLALAQTDKGSAVRPRHVVVFGYIGKDNFGDELIFSIIARAVRERYPGAYVSVIGHDPAATLRRHGVVSVLPTMKGRVAALLDGASALVFMAGIMFDQPFVDWTCGPIDLYLNPHSEIAGQTACSLLAWQYEVPTVYAGIGAGPLANRDARKLVELASLTRPRYIARDENTAELLRTAGVDPSLVEVKADLAMSLEKPAPTERLQTWLAEHGLTERGYMTVALREAPGVAGDPCPAVAALCDHAYEAFGLRPVFIDFAPEDWEVHRRVVEKMKHGDEAVLFGDTTDADLTLEVLGGAKTYVAMRLHCSIVSNAYGIVGLGLNYNDKVEAHYDAMGLRACLLPCDCDPDGMTRAFDAMYAALDDLAVGVDGAIAVGRCKAREALAELFDVIDGTVPAQSARHLYSRAESVDTLQLDRERVRTQALERRIQELEEQLADVEASTTWKVGRLATAVPRALKRAWHRRADEGGR